MTSTLSFILAFIGLWGAGVAMGYRGCSIWQGHTSNRVTWSNKWRILLFILKNYLYADGSTIASIEAEISAHQFSEAISDNLKKAIIATEDEHFMEQEGIMELMQILRFLRQFNVIPRQAFTWRFWRIRQQESRNEVFKQSRRRAIVNEISAILNPIK